MPDLKSAVQRQIMESFFLGYQAFTAKPDEMLARRGLSRVHHRILFFIASYPDLSVKELLSYLGVTKQALNTPLRQLIEMHLVESLTAEDDKRKRMLRFTTEGRSLSKHCAGNRSGCYSAPSMTWGTVCRRLARGQPGARHGKGQRLTALAEARRFITWNRRIG